MKPNYALQHLLEKEGTFDVNQRCIIADLDGCAESEKLVEALNSRGVIFGELDVQHRASICLNSVTHSMSNFELSNGSLYADVKLKDTPACMVARGFSIRNPNELKFGMRSMVDKDGNRNVITFDMIPNLKGEKPHGTLHSLGASNRICGSNVVYD